MAHRATIFGRGRVLTALALVFTTLLAGCELLDGRWSTTDTACTNVPGDPCMPPPPP